MKRQKILFGFFVIEWRRSFDVNKKLLIHTLVEYMASEHIMYVLVQNKGKPLYTFKNDSPTPRSLK